MPAGSSSPLPRRLEKVVRERLGIAVQRVEALWRDGRIDLGRPCPFGLAEMVYEDDEVRVDSAPLPVRPGRVAYALHKPAGVTSTARDPDGLRDLSPWLRASGPGVFPVGRLDRDTTGLLLLTNDGDLAYALLSPGHAVEKEYRAQVRWQITESDPRLSTLRAGVALDGRIAKPVCARLETGIATGDGMGQSPATCPSRMLTIVLTEGAHRQVRRMCKAAGLPLSGLSRVRIGTVHLGNLEPGGVRALDDQECDGLLEAVGGVETIRQRQHRALVALAARRRESGSEDVRLEAWIEENRPRLPA